MTAQSRRTGWRNATVAGLTVGVVALGLFKTCSPATEGPITQPPAAAAPVKAESKCAPCEPKVIATEVPVEVQVPPPVRKDGNCERDKGENGDPTSRLFSPEDCGYCGDGVKQENETPETCPVEFHCGNGKVDRGTVFGGIVPVQNEGETTYQFGPITVKESCIPSSQAFCEQDCPKQTAQIPECAEPVVRDLYNRVYAGVIGGARQIRAMMGATDRLVEIQVTISVNADGQPTIKTGTVDCGRRGCGNPDGASNVLKRAAASLRSVNSGRCTATLEPVVIPVEREGAAQ